MASYTQPHKPTGDVFIAKRSGDFKGNKNFKKQRETIYSRTTGVPFVVSIDILD